MIKELRKYDSQKIKTMIIQLKAQLLANRFKFAQAELTNTGIFRETRKLIAQLFTILSERKEKLTTSDWKVYSDIIAKNESIKGLDILEKEKVEDILPSKDIKEIKEVETIEVSPELSDDSKQDVSETLDT